MQEKAFDKIQYPFMIKTLESWYKGNIPQHNIWISFSLMEYYFFKLY